MKQWPFRLLKLGEGVWVGGKIAPGEELTIWVGVTPVAVIGLDEFLAAALAIKQQLEEG